MPLVCPHCSRANLADAQFCHHDGVCLLASTRQPIDGLKPAFAAPFAFSSGPACRNFDDFVIGCLTHWEEAVDLLQRGAIKSFFGQIGRRDLMHVAEEAANFPDRDRGLDLLLTRLPSQALPPPKIEVQPKLVTLGPLKVGVNRSFEVTLENRGRRLIHGSIASNRKWLAVTETDDARHFQFRSTSTLTVHIKGQHLRAGKPLDGTLVIETNAGSFTVKVVAEVPIVPFPDGVLAGARSPREIAEKAKASSRQAVPLFESGAVARWYQANGWIYPVQDPIAKGVAALQQFYEALGLSKPPRVHISEAHVALRGKPGETVAQRVIVQAEANRPVYAHAASAAAWLTVKPIVMHGTTAIVPFEITIPAGPAKTLQTTLKIRANGNQHFEIPVEVAVESGVRSQESGVRKQESEVRSQESSGRTGLVSRAFVHLLPMALLGMLLFALVGWDTFSHGTRARQSAIHEEAQEEKPRAALPPEFKVAIHDEPDEAPLMPVARFTIEDEPEERFLKLPVPPVEVKIKDEPAEHDPPGAEVPIGDAPLVAYTLANPPREFGVSCTAAAGPARFKLLTYSATGSTNSTVARLDVTSTPFGSPSGTWTRKGGPLDGIAATPGGVQPSHATWTWGPVAFHRVLEVVPGQPVTVGAVTRRNLDTLLVRWIIRNQDRVPHSVAMRLQLDTLIGDNDGVPFTVPGSPKLVNTSADFRQAKEVPDFIQALEHASLKNPGTVAHLTLKVGGGIEPPSRLSLTHWPGNFSGWDVPVRSMGIDSAAVLYWPDQVVQAGAQRTIGFAYGLGHVAVSDKLGLTLGGSFEPGQNFTVTAYVENPTPGQTLRLHLPDGLRRLDSLETQAVPPSNQAGRNTSIVTWRVVVERTGDFRLKVDSSTGLSQAKTISIAQGNVPTGGKLTMDLVGTFEPGTTFRVTGKVNDPLADQTLTLDLPPGLSRVTGEATQRVPAPPAGARDAVVEWQVRVNAAGKHPVRVASSTGIAQTKTITIVQPGRAEGVYQIMLSGNFTPGNVFTVSTKVINPAPEQKLTLVLPKGLEHVDGAETQAVKAEAPLTWKVRIQEVGKYLIGVKSTTGVTQRKTIIIEPPSEQAGQFTFKLVGAIEPGKDFNVIAEIAQPVREQTLTLVLPTGLQLVEGSAVRKVPAPSEITWTVRATATGRLPVRIESSTGLARTKMITLTETTKSLFGR